MKQIITVRAVELL